MRGDGGECGGAAAAAAAGKGSSKGSRWVSQQEGESTRQVEAQVGQVR